MTMPNDPRIVVGCVVQLSPETSNPGFGGCFMLVTEVKSFGAKGFVQSLGTREAIGGQAHYRETWDKMAYVGMATWAPDDL